MIKKLIRICCNGFLWIFPVMPSDVCKQHHSEIRDLQKRIKVLHK